MTGGATRGVRALRADARRNQEQILVAARDVLIERGPGMPLDEVARRAGVGIGTLYRRFPNRAALLRAVVLDALARTRTAAEEALDGGDDGMAALARYLHAALDLRVSAVIPQVLDRLDLQDAELGPAREAAAAAVHRIVDAAHADGSLARTVGFADVATVLVRLARPLPGPVPAELDLQLAHRHLDLLLGGLRLVGAGHPLAGPELQRADLHALRSAAAARDRPAGA